MKGDFSRQTFKKGKHYSGVLMQQGRVQLDADWNEQQAINRYREEMGTGDAIGRFGTPKDEPGFGISVAGASGGGEGAVMIGKGVYYVDGILCENESDVSYDEQPDLLDPPGIKDMLGKQGIKSGLVYLDVWRRHVTALDDGSLRESALGGPDTATRLKTAWQVKVLPLKTDADPAVLRDRIRTGGDLQLTEWSDLTTCSGAGTMRARTKKETGGTPCLLPPEAGYRGLENRLYRVEIHKGGTRDTATFKWSRDNGTVVAAIEEASGEDVVISGIGREVSGSFNGGQWVEVVDDRSELHAVQKPGQLVQVQGVDDGNSTVTLTKEQELVDMDEHPKIRRWDQEGEKATPHGVKMTSGWLPLENGIEVQFSAGSYRTGDYWLFPARTSPGDIEWPLDAQSGDPLYLPPDGVQHHYCPLAVLVISNGKPAMKGECRLFFPPLSNISAGDISFDTTSCCENLKGAVTVQRAIEVLCDAKSDSCTVVALPGKGWETVFGGIDEAKDAHVCLQAGSYPLEKTAVIAKKGRVTVSGCGSATRIVAATSETALVFENCDSVSLRNAYVESGVKGSGGERQHLNGAVTFRNCGTVDVEGVTAKCPAGSVRASSCITVWNNPPATVTGTGRGYVRIRHCDLMVGHRQIGVLLVNTDRAHVEDNNLQVGTRPEKLVLPVMVRNTKYLKMVRELLVSKVRLLEGKALRGAGNVTLEIDDKTFTFNTDKKLASAWEKVLKAEPPGKKITTAREMRDYLTRKANKIIIGEGRIAKLHDFKLWYRTLYKLNPSAAEQGIVVAGQAASDVRILNNTVQGVIQGIRVGVSHSEKRQGKPDIAGSVLISGNRIEVVLPPVGIRERCGIFVGNCNSLVISENYLRLNPYNVTKKTTVAGIQVYGHLGSRMVIRHNHIENFKYPPGIYINPLNHETAGFPLWIVGENVAMVEVAAGKKKVILTNNFTGA